MFILAQNSGGPVLSLANDHISLKGAPAVSRTLCRKAARRGSRAMAWVAEITREGGEQSMDIAAEASTDYGLALSDLLIIRTLVHEDAH